jgi:NAD-dependent SIR2 family protein deacetylase
MNKNYKLPFLKSSYEESRRLIRSAMQDGNLVIFVGAGTSIESGVPSWKSAIRRIADRLGIKASDADTLKISQYYFNARGKKDYTAFMREIFRYNIPLRTTDVHDAFLRFNTGTIINVC